MKTKEKFCGIYFDYIIANENSSKQNPSQINDYFPLENRTISFNLHLWCELLT